MNSSQVSSLQLGDCWTQIGVSGDRTCTELQTYHHCRNCPAYAIAGRQLLNREVSPEYLSERTALLTQAKEEQSVNTISIGIFRLGSEWFALPAEQFREITEPLPVHSIPHRSNRVLLGAVNVRGEILLCISLNEILNPGLEPTANPTHPFIYPRTVVIAKESNHWAFLADEISGIHRIDLADLQNLPATLAKATRSYTKAIINWQNKSVSYLDDELLFYTLNHKIL